MKKLRVTVNGVSYEVDVEVLEDDDEATGSYGFPATSTTNIAPRLGSGGSTAAPPAPAPAAKPSAAPSSGGDEKNVLTSPIAGVVVEVKVKEGAVVKENDPVVVIEAMKMNTNVSSPVSGTVREIKVKSGEAVQQGQVLLTFE